MRTIANVSAVLWAIAEEVPSPGVNEIARRVGLDKSSVSRMLRELEGAGMVTRAGPKEPYRLGMGIIRLANIALKNLDLRVVCAPVVQQISNETGETSQLAVWDQAFAVIIEHAYGAQPIRAQGTIGEHRPAHCSSLGKVLLAYQTNETIEKILNSELVAYTSATITNPDRLAAELSVIRTDEVAYNRGEYRADLVGVASPVRRHDSTVVAAISLSGPAYRVNSDKLHELAQIVRAAARLLSERLGAEPNSRSD